MLLFSQGLRDALSEAREDNNVSLADLASAAGVGESVFRRLENGEASTSIAQLDLYLDAYSTKTGLSIGALLQRATELAPEQQHPSERSPEDSLETDLEEAAQQSESNGPHSEGSGRESRTG